MNGWGIAGMALLVGGGVPVVGQSSYLIVPFVLVLLAFAGTLVFTRLLGKRP